MEPGHTLLDVGCGCLRGGVYFVEYLESRNYFGEELSKELLDAGYDVELAKRGLQDKLPRGNLVQEGDFEFSKLPVEFDFAIAISVITHSTFNHIRTCLEKLHPDMKAGGSVYASSFEACEDLPTFEPQKHERGGTVTYGDRDCYHYWAADMEYAVRKLLWDATRVGNWNHPRNQMMMCFTRAE